MSTTCKNCVYKTLDLYNSKPYQNTASVYNVTLFFEHMLLLLMVNLTKPFSFKYIILLLYILLLDWVPKALSARQG